MDFLIFSDSRASRSIGERRVGERDRESLAPHLTLYNRFEQLCINWCNEKLQQKFTVDVFRSVVQEYESEGIPLASIQFEDNVDVINLIEGRMGAISILNEECVRPKGSDESFVSKLYAMNKTESDKGSTSVLIQNKRFHSLQFSI